MMGKVILLLSGAALFIIGLTGFLRLRCARKNARAYGICAYAGLSAAALGLILLFEPFFRRFPPVALAFAALVLFGALARLFIGSGKKE